MDKKKIVSICGVIVVIIVIAVCIAIVYFSKQDVATAENELQQTIEKYGSVEKETVNTVIAKLNTEIMDGGLNTPATDDSMVIENELYWYALTENISCYVRTVDFSGDKEKDFAELISLYFDKEGYNEETATNYFKKLIKSNKADLTEQEIDNLVKEAKANIKTNEMTNNGQGISVAIVETDNHYEYQVKRLYK